MDVLFLVLFLKIKRFFIFPFTPYNLTDTHTQYVQFNLKAYKQATIHTNKYVSFKLCKENIIYIFILVLAQKLKELLSNFDDFKLLILKLFYKTL